MKNALCIAILATAASGCTHAQLNRSTLFQASTLADLQFQQVLDNVARFVANPYTMPYFAYPTSGSTQIADGGTVSPTISWAPHSTASEMLGLSANRTITEGWGLVPVTNPDKLYAMRCAYQRVVGALSMPCDICDDRLGNYLPKDFKQRPECLRSGRLVLRRAKGRHVRETYLLRHSLLRQIRVGRARGHGRVHKVHADHPEHHDVRTTKQLRDANEVDGSSAIRVAGRSATSRNALRTPRPGVLSPARSLSCDKSSTSPPVDPIAGQI
jgi:hypothetical protein